MFRRNMTFQVLVSFKDLAVDFTWEEWQDLIVAQRILYRHVMLETYNCLVSLGYCITKSELIFRLEDGAEPCVVEKPLNWRLSGQSAYSGYSTWDRMNEANIDKNLLLVFSKSQPSEFSGFHALDMVIL